MIFSKDGVRSSAEAALAVIAVGWTANTAALNLAAVGVETNDRGFLRVDAYLRTSAAHVFAAGDVTGRLMLLHRQYGRLRGEDECSARRGDDIAERRSSIGSFTDPEYAQSD
jgi:pyruvate/2-oxoglutarate dehydrogenase complex dihydrolipoamide dehydrogenase (E3) component